MSEAKPLPDDIPLGVQDRFWSKVDRRGEDECWEWQAPTSSKGYGKFWVGYGTGSTPAHRFSLHLTGARCPTNRVVDHICRNRACVNPRHLRVVTNRENVLSGVGPSAIHATKTHCLRGHEYTPENTYRHPTGYRECRACKSAIRERSRRKGGVS